MNWLGKALGFLIGKLGFKGVAKFNEWRGARQVARAARRAEAPKPPTGYRPGAETFKPRTAADLYEPLYKEQPLELPEITQADYDYNREQLRYDELVEYRDQLTELLTSFDFPPEIVEQVSNIDLDVLEGADFTRLNGAIDRLERYRLAYEGGYITSDDFDYDYIINEINSSVPGLNLVMPDNYPLSMFSDIFNAFL